MNLFISIDKKNKTSSLIEEQVKNAKIEAEKEIGKTLIIVDSINKADYAWFVDEWEDDITCYKEHEYCKINNIKIIHDKSTFWNRTL